MSIINQIKIHWDICAILIVAIVLRFLPITEYQFSYDELSSLNRTFFSSFVDTVNYGVKIDAHPALVQVFLWLWVGVFGYSEVALKLPFLICGILAVYYIYDVGNKFFNKQTGLLAATLLSASFIFLIYSSYIRMYITGVLFSVLVLKYMFHIIFSDTTSKKDYVLFALSALLCAYNHHISSLFAFTVGGFGLIYVTKQKRMHYVLSCIAIVILYLPHLQITLYQFSKAGIGTNAGGWLPPPRLAELYYFLTALFGTGLLGTSVLVLLCCLMAYFFLHKEKVSKQQVFVLSIFILNYTIIHLYSLYRSPILQYSVLLFCGMAGILFFSSFAKTLTHRQTQLFCGAVLVLLLFQSVISKKSLSSANKHSFEMQAKVYLSLEHEKVFGIFSGDPFYPYVYERKYHTKMKYVLTSDTVFESVKSSRRFLANLNCTHLILSDATPQLVELAKEKFPYVKSHQQGNFYNIIVLTKNKVDVYAENNYVHASYNILNNLPQIKLETQINPTDGYYKLDSTSGEFPFAAKTQFSQFNATEGEWLLVQIDFETDSMAPTQEDLLAISINTADSTKNYFTGCKFSDFYANAATNKLLLQVFVGSDYKTWINSGEFVCFVWKKDKSTLKIKQFTITQLDYNPYRWALWR